MTRNIYLGGVLDGLLQINDPNQIPGAVAQIWGKIQATNFPARAGVLAAEIEASQPHLIGLQEATEWRKQSPSDFIFGNRAPNATAMQYDFVKILLDSLAARGLQYREVSRVRNRDVELPMYTGQAPLPFDDLRYTDYNVILARADVGVLQSWANNFAAKPPLVVAGLPIDFRAGWNAVEAAVERDTIIFANTHLEIQPFRPVGDMQATELIAWLEQFDRTVIATGDFNSAANPGAPAQSKATTYDQFFQAGYVDLWVRNHGPEAGLTCCHAPDLLNQTATFDQRLDIVFARQNRGGFTGGAQLSVVGASGARTAGGLWPSDHAGVVATLRLPAAF
jgi:hypothetical protein